MSLLFQGCIGNDAIFYFREAYMKSRAIKFFICFFMMFTSCLFLASCGDSSDQTYRLIIAGMTDTEERRESIDFTNYYYESELVLVVRSIFIRKQRFIYFVNRKIYRILMCVEVYIIICIKIFKISVFHLNADCKALPRRKLVNTA